MRPQPVNRNELSALSGTPKQEIKKDMDSDFADFFESAVVGIFRTTEDGRYLAANPALVRMYGYESEADLVEKLTDISGQLYVDPKRRDEFKALMEKDDQLFGFESQIYQANGNMIWISENVRAVRDTRGRVRHYEGIVINISKRHRAEEQLRREALYDSLTRLPNRTLLLDRLKQVLSKTSRDSSRRFTLIVIGLDGFKVINNSLGHVMGDKLLSAMAAILKECVRPGDTVARLGGDEFALLLDNLTEHTDCELVLSRIFKRMAMPIEIEQTAMHVGVSAGVVNSGVSYRPEEPQVMLRDADTALTRAKKAGRSRVENFDPSMHLQVLERLHMESELRRAVLDMELMVYYQPIMRLHDGRLAGFEALLRWKRKDGSFVSPAHFIPLAESTDLILEIGSQVLMDSTRALSGWKEAYGDQGLFMSVNVSGRQIKDGGIVDMVESVMQAFEISGSELKLEITESLMMTDPDAALQTLERLRTLGPTISLDDFGTGYSSLAYLQRFPIDTLKIDRAFVQAMGQSVRESAMVKTILSMASALEMEVVAEGIEKESEGDYLRGLGCHYGQGFYYAKPLPEAEARALVKREAEAIRRVS